jgi:hypothetical protein
MRDRLIRAAVVAGAVVLLAAALGAASAAAYTPPPVIPWETVLPPLPTSQNPQFHGVPGCPVAEMSCIDTEISRMDALRRQLGCDHRAVFATTYELLTLELRAAMLSNPHLFADPSWVIGEDATFANMYFDSFSAYESGKPVPPAWQVAFDAARSGDDNAVQDMLAGINAHVQRDMPFMMASVGLRTPAGATHKPDHDVFNNVLNQAYPVVADTIAQRFDPIENLIAPGFNPLLGLTGNVLGDQLVQGWRELVWRNAEQLLNAPSPAALSGVASSIEGNAVLWARLTSAPQLPPGYRASRDAYCAAHNVGPLPPVTAFTG